MHSTRNSTIHHCYIVDTIHTRSAKAISSFSDCFVLHYHHGDASKRIAMLTEIENVYACRTLCRQKNGCSHFNYGKIHKVCYLKSSDAVYEPHTNTITGPVNC